MTYRYAGDDMVDDLPEYTITELPEGYAENQEERIATQIQVSILYQSDIGYPITLHYIYLQEGAASQFVLDSTDDVVIDNVNGYEAYIFAATGQENDSNAKAKTLFFNKGTSFLTIYQESALSDK